MRLSLAAAALLLTSSAAFVSNPVLAQNAGTSPTASGTTPQMTAAPPAATATPTPGSQTPAASVNSTPQTSSASPSAVQTQNTTHRTAAAPVAGRNSFTQSQAARRIAAAGYTKVAGLKKDGHGIWRGQAQKDGNPVSVSLDYQGNVTGQ